MTGTAIAADLLHVFGVKERQFAFDVNGCVFYEVDGVTADVLRAACATCEDDLASRLSTRHPPDLVRATWRSIQALLAAGELVSPRRSVEVDASAPPRISTLCLNVSQRCNLRCAYCFAEGGTYGQDARLMTRATAERAVDFLVRSSGPRRDLSVSFFGGEPLLNLDVMRHTVGYARRVGAAQGKEFRFHVTTNGVLLTARAMEFIERNALTMIVSLDGPREVNDSMRRFPGGRGSYDVVCANLKSILSTRSRPLTVRSTFTRKNLEVDELALHLASIGCKDVSVEPCVTSDPDLQLREQDLPALLRHYDLLADRYLEEMRGGSPFSFFHFRHAMDQAAHGRVRITQCGAAHGYAAVGADGTLYPCHKFVGKSEYALGDVRAGITRPALCREFRGAHVGRKAACQRCWARFACGGGCHAHALGCNGDLLQPDPIECALIKHRVELGAYLHAASS